VNELRRDLWQGPWIVQVMEAAAKGPETDSWLDSLDEKPTPEEIYEHFSCFPIASSGQVPVMPFEGAPNAPGNGLSGYGPDFVPSLQEAFVREED
jgi:hypothetical protein